MGTLSGLPLLSLVARIAGIGAFCTGAVYLTSAAFVPSMATGAWEFLFISFAGVGLALGVYVAIHNVIGKRTGRSEGDG